MADDPTPAPQPAAAPSEFIAHLPFQGPDVNSFLMELGRAYNADADAGKISDEAMREMTDRWNDGLEAQHREAERYQAEEFNPRVQQLVQDEDAMGKGMFKYLREHDPEADITHVQQGDIPLEVLVHVAQPAMADSVDLTASANLELLDHKQASLDVARELIEIRSQQPDADPAMIQAQTDKLHALEAEMDAARKGVEEGAQAAHRELDGAEDAARKIDQHAPHGSLGAESPNLPAAPVVVEVAAVDHAIDHGEVAYADVSVAHQVDDHAAANAPMHDSSHDVGAGADATT